MNEENQFLNENESTKDDYTVQRTIEEVIDVDTGEIIIADDFFKQSDDIVLLARRTSDMGYKADMPKFRCLFCEQGVKISGRKNEMRESLSYFFAHYKDSDDCPIKTGTGKRLNEILADKYKGINEGELHKKLKSFISASLQSENAKEKGINNVLVEHTFKNAAISDNWRRPDVSADYAEKKMVFELQLSTTFLSVLVERDNFYRQHQTFIVWVFGGLSENEMWQKLMEKDIYYANKRNVFVLDKAAQTESEKRKELILTCYWQIPNIEKGQVKITWHKKLVSLDELSFDEEQYKVYYHDSDKDFYDIADPEKKAILNDWEAAKEERWRKIIENIDKRAVSEEQRQKRKVKQQRKEDEKQTQIEAIVEQGEKQNQNFTEDLGDGISLDMIFVEGGTFMMGSDDGYDHEKPIHSVTLDSFWIGKFQVTQAQWKVIIGDNPSHFKGDNLPVEYISWDDAQAFIKRLNQKTDKKYRLLTEAEWEYAARGGNESKGYKYSGSNDIDEVAWYYGNSDWKTHPVGQKKANELGIFDMSGNVWESCEDWYGGYYYKDSPSKNPEGADSGSLRICRGGSWHSHWKNYRVAYRTGNSPENRTNGLGFRLAFSSSIKL